MHTTDPESVFSREQLADWAVEHGWVSEGLV